MERRRRRRDRRRGPGARWRRWSSPACAARPSCARRTPSWPRRSRSWPPAGARCSSTATATTCAPRCEDVEAKVRRHRPQGRRPRAHRRPRRVRGRRRSPTLCARRGRLPLEDCAHAHGARGTAEARGRGATPACTPSTPPRPSRPARAACSCRATTTCSSSRAPTATTASPTTASRGLNFRMSEFTAALALVQTERMEEIVAWKNAFAREHLDPRPPRPPRSCPTGWSPASTSTSSSTRSSARRARSTTEPCHRIMGTGDDLPNSDWVGEHHWCAPLYYRQATNGAHA